MRPVDVKPDTYFDFPAQCNKRNVNLCLVITYESGSRKIYFQSVINLTGQKYKNLKILKHAHVIEELNGEEIISTFHEKERQKNKPLRVCNGKREKGDQLSVKWKGYDNSLNSSINANTIVQYINPIIFR